MNTTYFDSIQALYASKESDSAAKKYQRLRLELDAFFAKAKKDGFKFRFNERNKETPYSFSYMDGEKHFFETEEQMLGYFALFMSQRAEEQHGRE